MFSYFTSASLSIFCTSQIGCKVEPFDLRYSICGQALSSIGNLCALETDAPVRASRPEMASASKCAYMRAEPLLTVQFLLACRDLASELHHLEQDRISSRGFSSCCSNDGC